MAMSKDLSVISVTASVTQTQAGGTVINGDINLVTTANASDAVTIPANLPKGTIIYVRNLSSNAGIIFPPVGGTINAAAADASVALAVAPAMVIILVTASGSASTYNATKTAAV